MALAVFVVILGTGWSASASENDTYPAEMFAVNELYFDAVRQACGIECLLASREAKDIISAVAGYMGVDPAYVRLGTEAAAPSSRIEGEETFYTLPFPSGYQYCNSRINVVSLMSASPDPKRASLIDASVHNNAMGIYTWTGKPRPGEGQSSVEGYALVTGIKPQYFAEFKQKGICKDAPPQNAPRKVLFCRGNPCSGGHDGGANQTGSSTSALKSPPAGF